MNISSAPWDLPEGYIPYKNRTEEEKQMHWNHYIYIYRRQWKEDSFPLNLANFRNDISVIEPNLNRFLPWVIDATMWLLFEHVEDLFILDESAKVYLLENAKELLEKHGWSEIQKFIHETKKNVEQNLWE